VIGVKGRTEQESQVMDISKRGVKVIVGILSGVPMYFEFAFS